jgi:molybdopterin-binding protein
MEQLSARNSLKGTIMEIKAGPVVSEVVLRVGDNQIAAVITTSSVQRLGLKVGDEATAVIKATEVMIGK